LEPLTLIPPYVHTRHQVSARTAFLGSEGGRGRVDSTGFDTCERRALTGFPWSSNMTQSLGPIRRTSNWALGSAEPLVVVMVLSRDAFVYSV
jgi:hypothetical protein